jgi:hypothetical protein
MRKSAMICLAGVAAMMIASSAKAVPVVTTANGLSVWLDVRDTSGAITSPVAPWTVGTSLFTNKKTTTFTRSVIEGNDGGPGDGYVLYISPRLPTVAPDTLGKHWTGSVKKGFINQSVKTLSEYITVGDRTGNDDVISALGRNVNLVKAGAAGNGNKIQSISTSQVTGLWSPAGTSSSVTDNGGTQTDWTVSMKAVKVPVAGPPPTFSSAGGAVPSGIYRVSTMTITAGEWNKAAGGAANASPLDSVYCVKVAVNNLLITRAYNNASPPTGLTPELPDFGYLVQADPGNPPNGDTSGSGQSANLPEAASGNGSTSGVTSTQCDAEVRVQMKGDFNNDGLTNTADQADFNAAITASSGGSIRVRELYLGDFDNNSLVNTADQAGLNAYTGIAGLGCPPCP